MSDTLAQTYVWHEGKKFFVSTINRESSAMLAPGMYAETIVWDWCEEDNRRGNIIRMAEGCEGSLTRHFQLVQLISNTGKCFEEEEDD